MGVDLEYLVGEQAGLLLYMPDRATDREFGLERREFVPALEAAMGVNGKCQQFIEYRGKWIENIGDIRAWHILHQAGALPNSLSPKDAKAGAVMREPAPFARR
jgi:hypothetical protein